MKHAAFWKVKGKQAAQEIIIICTPDGSMHINQDYIYPGVPIQYLKDQPH